MPRAAETADLCLHPACCPGPAGRHAAHRRSGRQLNLPRFCVLRLPLQYAVTIKNNLEEKARPWGIDLRDGQPTYFEPTPQQLSAMKLNGDGADLASEHLLAACFTVSCRRRRCRLLPQACLRPPALLLLPTPPCCSCCLQEAHLHLTLFLHACRTPASSGALRPSPRRPRGGSLLRSWPRSPRATRR